MYTLSYRFHVQLMPTLEQQTCHTQPGDARFIACVDPEDPTGTLRDGRRQLGPASNGDARDAKDVPGEEESLLGVQPTAVRGIRRKFCLHSRLGAATSYHLQTIVDEQWERCFQGGATGNGCREKGWMQALDRDTAAYHDECGAGGFSVYTCGIMFQQPGCGNVMDEYYLSAQSCRL